MQDVSQVRELVQAFRENHQALKDQGAPEAVIRQEYIDTLWKLLGWDVHNQHHRSLAEKDVVVEGNVGTVEEREIHHRRPDYLFRIDGFPRFIVEAKSCAVDIATDKDAIFQAKTYAWSAQIPFAILTNFEQFRLFDTTVKPDYDAAGVGVVVDFDLRFEDYEQQWDVLEQAFAREAVGGGSLEKLLAKLKHVKAGRRIRGIDRMLIDLRGSEPVDRAFLAHIEDFRLRLARELYRENRASFPEANTTHGAAKLAEAAQRLVDRLVFIRVCEDRNIASYGELRDVVNVAREKRAELYPELVREFRRFDKRYNGYIFKPHFSEELTVPVDSLVDFIRSLYPPVGPYRFDAIADDILGIIYERFLGSAITVARGVVEAEPKPEVRHAGGVYYTPKFVVDTIVRRVVGPKIEGKSPVEILDVKILDPACGSGSFLIAALQYLYSHCLKCFEKDQRSAVVEVIEERGKTNRKVKKKKQLGFQDEEGNWHLMPEFRGQILQSCIYGVDIDAQAVEVTIMSLYLKMLEGRLPEHWQRDFLEARLLPPLDNNIRCGNSLISQTDFDRYWENEFNDLFGGNPDVRFRINAFDWTSQTRGFGRIFEERKGFDCIIGNPPYIRVQELNKWAPEECEFYKANYRSAAQGNYDIYVVFIEKALSLLAPNGLLGLICPHKFWQAAYGKGIREVIAKDKHLESVIDFADQQVFREATTYTAIHVLSKRPNPETIRYAKIARLTDGAAQCAGIDAGISQPGVLSYDAAQITAESSFVFASASVSKLMAHIASQGPSLGEVASNIFVGLQTSADDVFILRNDGHEYYSEALSQDVQLEPELVHPLLKGSVHVRRWIPRDTEQVVLFPYAKSGSTYSLISEDGMQARYPKTWDYLVACRPRLAKRERGTFEGPSWYGYVYPKNLAGMAIPKILTPSLAQRSEFCLDDRGEFYFVGSGGGGGGGYGITLPDNLPMEYVLGLMNSRVLDWYLKQITTCFHSGWYAYNKQFIERLAIKVPKTSDENHLAKRISNRVRQIIEAKRKLAGAHLSDRERAQLEREVESHEGKIDELVCELYGVKEIPE